jgi:hypothetical protein
VIVPVELLSVRLEEVEGLSPSRRGWLVSGSALRTGFEGDVHLQSEVVGEAVVVVREISLVGYHGSRAKTAFQTSA